MLGSPYFMKISTSEHSRPLVFLAPLTLPCSQMAGFLLLSLPVSDNHSELMMLLLTLLGVKYPKVISIELLDSWSQIYSPTNLPGYDKNEPLYFH